MTLMSEKKMNIAMLANELAALRTVCTNWQNGAYKRSNEELYAILERSETLLMQLRAEVKLRKRLNDALAALGVEVRTNTSLEMKVMWAVFGVENKRTQAYARVLKIAYQHKPKGWTLTEWIEHEGGIEEVRRKQKSGPSHKEQVSSYVETAESKLATAAALTPRFVPSEILQPADGGDYEYAIALVRTDKDGLASIVFGTNKTALVKAVLSEAGKKLQQTKEESDVTSKATTERTRRDEALSAIGDEFARILAA